jgi:ribose-phosphate pyrophosphokinase
MAAPARRMVESPRNAFDPSIGSRSGRVIVFWCPEMEFMADRLVAMHPASYTKGIISWSLFPDGTPNVKIEGVEAIRYNHVVILTSFRHPEKWVEQIAVIYALPRYMAKSLTIVLPFFPTGTMERVEKEGEIATAMTMARIFSTVPATMQGPPRLVMFDVHTLQQRFYFGDGIIPCLITAMNLLLDVLKEHPDRDNLTIVFPDDGAKKRFGTLFGEFPIVVCAKVRQGKERIVHVADGDPEGRHCLIVDDLVQSGGTLRTCKDMLLRMGASAVSGFITHAVFPNEAWRAFVNDGWHTVYLSDSIPETTKHLQALPPFRVISLAREIDRFLFE